MSHPAIRWLDTTFRTTAATEQLLRPDLESGLITQHDFHLASTFLPGNHRYWSYGYAALASSSVAAYGGLFRRPPLNINRCISFAIAAGFCGSLYGHFRRAKAHWAFTRHLDNPVAFVQALENVNKRTGGTEPLGWSLQRAVGTQSEAMRSGKVVRPQEDASWAPATDESVSDSDSAQDSRPPPSQAKPTTKWDELRAAHARATSQSSSWDALRQQHERERIVKKLQTDERFEYVDRAEEQARFDALVEAERKMASR